MKGILNLSYVYVPQGPNHKSDHPPPPLPLPPPPSYQLQSSHQAAAENGSGNEETMGTTEGETAASGESVCFGATDLTNNDRESKVNFLNSIYPSQASGLLVFAARVGE